MIDSLRAVTAVAIAEIDLSGLLLDANAGYLRQLPARSYPAPGIAVDAQPSSRPASRG